VVANRKYGWVDGYPWGCEWEEACG